MMQDIETLRHWLRVFLWISAICATSVPVVYAFSPWWKRPLGRAFMVQSIAFAVALDMTIIFQYARPGNILALFWINTFAFGLIAVSTACLAGVIVRLNYIQHSRKVHPDLQNESQKELDYE